MTATDRTPSAREQLRNAVLAERTAVRPDRVLVLGEREQTLILDLLETSALQGLGGDEVPWAALLRLHDRVSAGEEYANETDELVRKTLDKRRLEAAAKQLGRRIAELEEAVVEELVARGDTGGKHAGTGASYRLDRKVWARLVADTENMPRDQAEAVRASVKAAAALALIEAGLGDYVREDFNLNQISAHFRELIREHDAEQREKPEHERTPLDAGALLPEPLRGLIEIDDSPHIQVRAG